MIYLWFNKQDDVKPCMVRNLDTGEVFKAARVMMYGAASTLFRSEGFPPAELPGGPRFIVVAASCDMEGAEPWT